MAKFDFDAPQFCDLLESDVSSDNNVETFFAENKPDDAHSRRKTRRSKSLSSLNTMKPHSGTAGQCNLQNRFNKNEKIGLKSTVVKLPENLKIKVNSCKGRQLGTNVKIAKKIDTVLPSFEERNKLLQQKKQDFIKKSLEEERKARAFHANPIPKIYHRRRASSFSEPSSLPSSPSKSNTNITNENNPFRAKQQLILKNKSFEPRKESHSLEIKEFNLQIESRLQKRKEYDNYLKELEEERKYLKELKQLAELREQEAKIVNLRKLTEFKAQPIKKYRPIIIEYMHKHTVPKSPNFCKK